MTDGEPTQRAPQDRQKKLLACMANIRKMRELHRRAADLIVQLEKAIGREVAGMDPQVSFSVDDVRALRTRYHQALDNHEEHFEFKGHTFITAYAYYLLEYLIKQFGLSEFTYRLRRYSNDL